MLECQNNSIQICLCFKTLSRPRKWVIMTLKSMCTQMFLLRFCWCFVRGGARAEPKSKGDEEEAAAARASLRFCVAWWLLCCVVCPIPSLTPWESRRGAKATSTLLGLKKQGVPPNLVPIEKSSSVSYFFRHDSVDFPSFTKFTHPPKTLWGSFS